MLGARGLLTTTLLITLFVTLEIVEARHRDSSRIQEAKKHRRSQRANEVSHLGCSASHPPLRMVKYLDRICEDCYLLYRDPDIYSMCRSGCYSTNFLSGCMDVIMVSKSTRSKAANFVSLLNSHHT